MFRKPVKVGTLLDRDKKRTKLCLMATIAHLHCFDLLKYAIRESLSIRESPIRASYLDVESDSQPLDLTSRINGASTTDLHHSDRSFPSTVLHQQVHLPLGLITSTSDQTKLNHELNGEQQQHLSEAGRNSKEWTTGPANPQQW